MIGSIFHKTFSQLLKESSNIDHIISAYVDYLHKVIDDSEYISGYTIESGCMVRKTIADQQTIGPEIIMMPTTDIHRHLFSLQDYFLGTSGHMAGLPFLDQREVNTLTEDFSVTFGHESHLLQVMLYTDNLLQGMIFIIFAADHRPSEALINDLLFEKNTLEALCYKVMRAKERSTFNHLLSSGDLIIKSSQFNNTSSFEQLLNLSFELSGEADYGSILVLENGFWRYLHAIGHDFDGLKSIPIPGEMYLSRVSKWVDRKEVAPNIYVIPKILDFSSSKIFLEYENTFNDIIKVTQPIKETIQLHIYFNNDLRAVVCLDIKDGSNKSFTSKTIQVFRKIDFLSQFLFTNISLQSKNESLEKLIELISMMESGMYANKAGFLKNYLDLLVDSLQEVSYASVYTRDTKSIQFLATIGHDMQKLNSLKLSSDYFASQDDIEKQKIPYIDKTGHTKPIGATLLHNLDEYASEKMPKDVFQAYKGATMPIKDSIISQTQLSDETWMYITCDISAGSTMHFTRESIQLFSALNNLGFSYIANKELESIARKDSLTGLLNHNNILQACQVKMDAKESFSIFLFDIDYFKKVNDTFGHQTGDEVLIRISDYLLQDPDIIPGRYGGEEFLLILLGDNHKDASKYCEKLLNDIRTMDIIEGHPITVSGGLVCSASGHINEMISQADKLLYESKENGRNQFGHSQC